MCTGNFIDARFIDSFKLAPEEFNSKTNPIYLINFQTRAKIYLSKKDRLEKIIIEKEKDSRRLYYEDEKYINSLPIKKVVMFPLGIGISNELITEKHPIFTSFHNIQGKLYETIHDESYLVRINDEMKINFKGILGPFNKLAYNKIYKRTYLKANRKNTAADMLKL